MNESPEMRQSENGPFENIWETRPKQSDAEDQSDVTGKK